MESMSFSVDTSPVEPLVAAPIRKILVIDDSALIREAAKLALGEIGGWRITTAASGKEGIERAMSEQFDAILLDVVMPGMDGIAVAERLHAILRLSSLPIVLLTADERIEDDERFGHTSIVGVISKPFKLSDLSLQVAGLLAWPA
jgi:CheY-like chemotaxis protein